MKKVFYLKILFLCFGFSAIAQDIENDFNPAFANKRGVYLLPQAGDFAIGVDADPILINIFSLTGFSDEKPTLFNGVGQTIYGKYFLQDFRALRVRLSVNMLNRTVKGIVQDDVRVNAAENPDPNATLEDIQKLSATNFELGIGYELRRGSGRVQGFFGGEVFVGMGNQKATYEYGNSYTTTNMSPTNFTSFAFSPDETKLPLPLLNNTSPPIGSGGRILEDKHNVGDGFNVGVMAFVGVEYFFAPQISIGGQFGLGMNFVSRAQGEFTVERWNSTITPPATEAPGRETEIVLRRDWGAASELQILSRTSGNIFLMFHF